MAQADLQGQFVYVASSLTLRVKSGQDTPPKRKKIAEYSKTPSTNRCPAKAKAKITDATFVVYWVHLSELVEVRVYMKAVFKEGEKLLLSKQIFNFRYV
jgi:hypothetical protein